MDDQHDGLAKNFPDQSNSCSIKVTGISEIQASLASPDLL